MLDSPPLSQRKRSAGPTTSYALAEAALLPTPQNVSRQLARAQTLLFCLLASHGRPLFPPLHLQVLPQSGRIVVVGLRTDRAKIESLVNADLRLRRTMQAAQALAAQIPALPLAARYAQAWHAAVDEHMRQTLNADFQRQIARLPVTICWRLDRRGLTLNLNDQTLHATTS